MIWLASKSPRRREILKQMGLEFRTLDVDIDESVLAGEEPRKYVQRVAQEKAGAGWKEISERVQPEDKNLLVIAADTSVILGDQILGKPRDMAEAREMLQSLAGNRHRVLTAVCLQSSRGVDVALSETYVTFCQISPSELESYLASGESLGKAGAYAIQGLAARFVSHLEGSYSGVVGLPIHETWQLLNEAGLAGN